MLTKSASDKDSGKRDKYKNQDKHRWRNVAAWVLPFVTVPVVFSVFADSIRGVWVSIFLWCVFFLYCLLMLERYVWHESNRKLRVICVFLWGVAVGLGLVWQHSFKKPVAPPSTRLDQTTPTRIASPAPSVLQPLEPSVKKREFLDVDPEKLLTFFEKYNEAQAEGLVKPYIGKWMEIPGRVTEVSRELLRPRENDSSIKFGINVFMRTGRSGRPKNPIVTQAIFDEQRWIDRAFVLKRNEDIKVRGQLYLVFFYGFVLEHCEIIE